MKDEHALPPPLTTDALTDEERAERAHLIEAGKAAKHRGDLAYVEFGQHLRELRDRRLYREGGHTWATFLDATFEVSDEHARRLINLTDLHDALIDEGVKPLTVELHARVVSDLPPESQVEVVRRAHELAEAEGKRLFVRHLKDARNELILSDDALDEDDEEEDELDDEVTYPVRDAVRAQSGLHIVLPDGLLPDGAVEGEAYLPGRVITPYEDLAATEDEETPSAPWSVQNGGQGLTRADLDEAAEFVWPVLVPDAWEAATTWEAPNGPFRAIFFPKRLGAPTAPVNKDKKHEREKGRVGHERGATVLVAPGIDLLSPEVPAAVLHAVVEAAGTNPERRYLFLTAHPRRVTEVTWPVNTYVCVTAHGAASVTAMSEVLAGVLEDHNVRFVLVLRDADDALPAEALQVFDWVLLRGSKTSQACFESVFCAVSQDIVHVSREVRARHQGYATLPELPAEPAQPHREHSAVPILSTGDGVISTGDGASTPGRPPTISGTSSEGSDPH